VLTSLLVLQRPSPAASTTTSLRSRLFLILAFSNIIQDAHNHLKGGCRCHVANNLKVSVVCGVNTRTTYVCPL
ncbi:hypothetical protein EJB05_17663, partial [Eragrostis curvula]